MHNDSRILGSGIGVGRRIYFEEGILVDAQTCLDEVRNEIFLLLFDDSVAARSLMFLLR